MNPRIVYRSSDFEEPVIVRRRSLAFAAICAVLLLASTHLVAFYFGSWWALETAREEARRIVSMRRAPDVVNPPAALLKCDKEGREEFLRTCRARNRSL